MSKWDSEPPRRWLLFWLVIAVTVVTRYLRLAEWDMWTDEAQTLLTAQSAEFGFGPMYITAPINFILTRFAVAVFGPNELGLRLVPFLAGVLAVALVYHVVRIWLGTRPALLAALVVAVSMWHVRWSQTGRHFSLQALLILLAVHWYLIYDRRDRMIALAGASFAFLLALFVHSSSGLYIVALLVFVGGKWLHQRLVVGAAPGELRKRAVAAAWLLLPLLIYLPIYVVVGKYLLANRTAWNPPWNILASFTFFTPPYLSFMALAGGLFLIREHNDLGLLLLSVWLFPTALLTAASSVTIASAAYCLASVMPVAALAGTACDRLLILGRRTKQLIPAAAVVAGLFVGQLYDLAHYYTVYNGFKGRWREATVMVGERREPGSLFVAAEGDVAQYYLGNGAAEWFDAYEQKIGSPGFPPEGVTGVWYVLYWNESPILRMDERVARYIKDNASLVGLYPVQYGGKDKTLAVFHQRVSSGQQVDSQ